MTDKAGSIHDRFPDQSSTITHLKAKDPEFLALCEDYNACVDALRHWSVSKEPEADIRVAEYRTLIRELEDEILQVLQD